MPQPASYSRGWSQAFSQESQCSQRRWDSEYTSVHTWSETAGQLVSVPAETDTRGAFSSAQISGLVPPVLSHTYRASRPSARQHSVKQLAHSPQRPLLVCKSFSGLLYLVLTDRKHA